ncbi:polymeric immunoglobulin receptor-like isoform X2 [Rhinichthys klamathensis goyatoka]|uniref:polymeric immunoglobulin receptor-like isoform X2 n=1 Tax=Rhinichthys klamathensis goyatoka TaxID=3034132 RepID=UPI0024B497FF|nr:polymeric immunoglobulin receptor-like isoform X2 [Rhinichthys klamathensis goyatoka]
MSTVLFFTFVCCIGAQNIGQPKRLQTSKLGDDVTIECYLPNTDFNNMVWYKQGMGMKLQAISKTYIYMTDVEFIDGNTDGRFNVTIEKGIYHLHISLTKKEDIGTYFCGVVTLGELYFGPGTFLMLHEHTATMVLQEPISDKAHIGNNITLVCRVKKVDEKCAGGHHAYWFKEAADESHPAIIYADEDMKKQHEGGFEDDSTTQICIYTLAKRNLSLSDAGTYYCAVLACGKIVFGNGTHLEFIPDSESTATPLFLILVSSNIISMIIMILLVAVRCEDQGRSSACFNRSCDQETSEGTQQVEDADALTYTPVSFSSRSRPSRGAKQHNVSQRNDVYSKIRS